MQLIFGIFVVIRLKQIKLNKNLRLDSCITKKVLDGIYLHASTYL